MGQEAYDFADFLQASGMTIWQVLPIGPTGYGESPYQSSSVFAGNPLLISCRRLREEGLLQYEDAEECEPSDPETVDYESVRDNKNLILPLLQPVPGATLRADCRFPRRKSLGGRFCAFHRRKSAFSSGHVVKMAG